MAILEQTCWLGLPVPAIDDQLAALDPIRTASDGVVQLESLHLEVLEALSNRWVIVDADHGFAPDSLQSSRHQLVLFPRKWYAIAFSFPVRRVRIEQRMRSVVAVNARGPIELLDVGAARQAQMRC